MTVSIFLKGKHQFNSLQVYLVLQVLSVSSMNQSLGMFYILLGQYIEYVCLLVHVCA